VSRSYAASDAGVAVDRDGRSAARYARLASVNSLGSLRRTAPAEREPTVSSKALRVAMAAASAAGLDAAALASAHGISQRSLDDADARFSHDLWVAIFTAIEQHARDPSIGLRLAAELPMGHWDAMDFMIAASATVGDAVERIERYFVLISTAVDHRTVRVGDELHVRREHRPGVTRSRAATELAVATIVRRLRALSATPVNPRWVAFAHARGAAASAYERSFGCPVYFERDADVIALSLELLDAPMAAAQPALCVVLERHASLLIERASRADEGVVQQVRAAVATELHNGAPTLATVARRLATSARTLQRRLDAQGQRFLSIVEETRFELARGYLADPQISLGEVGYLVGFADPSAFSKAFRRWSGESPTSFRARERAAIGGRPARGR
jgi:AraC-like DNA-binding protein